MISKEEFSKALEPLLPNTAPIAVAVSGGSDSLCLCLLLGNWAKDNGTHIVALTVDHQLRIESAQEAAQVHEWLEQRGIKHHTLKWEKSSTPANIQDSARKARYNLLSQFCESNNIPYLAVAHNMEDQVETILLRLAHHSGPSGLAGISNKRNLGQVTILRPLLNFSKSQIIDTLQNLEQPWIEDPSNKNNIYTRVKIRQQQSNWNNFGLTKERISSFQKKMSSRRINLETEANMFCSKHITEHPEGHYEISLKPLTELDKEISEIIIANILKLVSGKIYPPRYEKMLHILSKLSSGTIFTCHGCLIKPSKDKLIIRRETPLG